MRSQENFWAELCQRIGVGDIFTAKQSLLLKGSAGDPLPVVYPSLAPFLKGQLCIICAAAGSGKSALVLSYAAQADVSTLYFSADSDPFVMLSRLISIQLGWPLENSADAIRRGVVGPDAERVLERSKIRFDYRASPSLPDIRTSLDAYNEVYGGCPGLVVVDNVTNVRTELNVDDPFAGLEVVMEELHEMARETGSCVVGLHHVTGPFNDGDKPIPLSGVKGQISRVPEMIWTLFRSSLMGNESLNVSNVKNRNGRSDPTGNTYASLVFDGDTMTIKDSSS